jgi:hypothetical protein
MDDLEEVYLEGIEREGEIFIEGLQNKKGLAELEKQYSEKVKEIRRIYEKSFKKELNKEKKTEQNKKKIENQKKDEKEFHVKNLTLDKNWREKEEIEITSFGYKIKRKIRDFIQVIIPNYFIYLYYKIKRNIRDISKEVRDFFDRIMSKVSSKIANIFSYIKDGFFKIVLGIKKIAGVFKKKKPKEKEKEKKDDTKKSSGK